jgi:hypothetical protein
MRCFVAAVSVVASLAAGCPTTAAEPTPVWSADLSDKQVAWTALNWLV